MEWNVTTVTGQFRVAVNVHMAMERLGKCSVNSPGGR